MDDLTAHLLSPAGVVLSVMITVTLMRIVYKFAAGHSTKKKSSFVSDFLKGQARATVSVQHKDLGLEPEVLRDFSRNLCAGDTLFVYTEKTGVIEVEPVRGGGNFSPAACTDFKDHFLRCFDKYGASEILGQDIRSQPGRVMAVLRMLTVSPGFKVAMDLGKSPTFLQPRFVVVLSPLDLRVATYAFVGPGRDIRGDQPSTKHTPYACRLMTPNLLRLDPAGMGDVELQVDCYETNETSTKTILQSDPFLLHPSQSHLSPTLH